MSNLQWSLPQHIKLAHVVDLKNDLTPLLEKEQDIHVDASGVSSIDSAGLQLLIAASQHQKMHNHALILEKPSDAILKFVESAHAKNYLEIQV